jgi:hypothetical protein
MPDDSTDASCPIDDRLNLQANVIAPLSSQHFEHERAPIRYSLKGLLIGVTLLVCAIGLVAFLARQADVRRRHNEIRNALRQAYLSASVFDDARRRLPAAVFASPDGKPLSSWRFQVAPYWGINWLGRQYYDAAWDASINAQPRSMGYYVNWTKFLDDSPSTTNVFAISGPDTAFEVGEHPSFSKYKLINVPGYCILLMEVADSKTHWMQPGDYDVTKLLAATGRLGDTVKGLLKDRVHILFADGEVWALSPDMPIDALKPFLTITAAKNADRDKQLAHYRVD